MLTPENPKALIFPFAAKESKGLIFFGKESLETWMAFLEMISTQISNSGK